VTAGVSLGFDAMIIRVGTPLVSITPNLRDPPRPSDSQFKPSLTPHPYTPSLLSPATTTTLSHSRDEISQFSTAPLPGSLPPSPLPFPLVALVFAVARGLNGAPLLTSLP
jgi:hypothetical protein